MGQNKFRGKLDKDYTPQCLVYGDLVRYAGNHYIMEDGCNWDILESGCRVIPKTVNKSIGIFDKARTEIYGGDILKIRYKINDNEYYVHGYFLVIPLDYVGLELHYLKPVDTDPKNQYPPYSLNYRYGTLRVGAEKQLYVPSTWEHGKEYHLESHDVEIVGNMHENPELLERKNENISI